MEKMIYGRELKKEVLEHGLYRYFEYYILSIGTHPTAYVNLHSTVYANLRKPKKNMEEKIMVHGGITFKDDELEIEENKIVKGYWIGWDYNHYNDYDGYFSINGTKQWTTEEIFEDVKDVINQIIAMEENK